jgi:hypothetical protein
MANPPRQAKLRHDLYDRRFAIYVAFRELLLALIEKNNDEITVAFRKASIARFEAPFVLADTKIGAHLDALCKQVTDDVFRGYEVARYDERSPNTARL